MDLVFAVDSVAAISLGVTFGLVAGGVLFSLWKTRGRAPAQGRA